MHISEIFYSIQGESSYAGRSCVFVRTTGCHLRCVWCDTAYAFHGGTELSIEEIVEEVRRLGGPCRLVELTGGEPLLQREIGRLAARLLDGGYTVLLETSGALPVDRVPPQVIKIVDFKPPGSGESQRNDWRNVELLDPGRDELKFVIADRRDYEWCVEQIRNRGLERFTIHFSPEFGGMNPARLAGWILEDGLPARLQLQIHKIVWGPDARGV